MSILITSLLAALPNVFIAIFAKILSQSTLQVIVEKVVIFSLQKVVKLTSNTLDDEIVQEIVDRFNGIETPVKGRELGDMASFEYELAIQEALARKDFKEYARLINERGAQ